MNSKFNKKKKMLVILSIVLMLTMVVGMGAFTFAKYVTTQTAGDRADAAQWGFVITADASDLFGTDYTLSGTGTSATVVQTGSGVAVKATGTGNVVAPGTTGSMTFSISGKAEVLAKVSLELAAATKDIYLDTYYPVKWTLKENGTSVRTDVTLSEALTALESSVDGIGSIAPGTEVNKTYVISWTWAFDSGNNKSDTVLGLLAGGKTIEQINAIYGENTVEAGKYGTSIAFGFTVTVEQTQSAS